MNLSQLSPSTAPPWMVCAVIIGTILLVLWLIVLFFRARASYREWRRLDRSAAHLQAMARTHAKMHEGDNRNY